MSCDHAVWFPSRRLSDEAEHLRRLFEQAPKSFSWWDYRMLGFQKNRGLRIDIMLVSQPLVPHVTSCGIDRAPRKWEKPSDHTPVVLTLGQP